MREIVSRFEHKFGMIQAFGCIDGTHVQIKRPHGDSQDYFCYKQYFSLNIQALCDSKGKFLDVECRWPGSVHDAKMFANSAINLKICNGDLPRTVYQILPGFEGVQNYLIGDPAYPLTSFCMKEHATCSTNEEAIFNDMLRSARNTIECAFGRVKDRCGLLRKSIGIKVENVPILVYTCFVLHNFCESFKDCEVDNAEIQSQILLHQKEDQNMPNLADQIYSSSNEEGEYVRNLLTKNIKDNLPGVYND